MCGDVRDDHDRCPGTNRRLDVERAVVERLDGDQPGRRLEHEHEHHEKPRGGNATSSSGVRGSGNSTVNLNVTMPSSTSGGSGITPQSTNSLQSSGAPGTNPYNPVVGKRQLLRDADDQDEPLDPGAGPHDHAVRYLHGAGERRCVVRGSARRAARRWSKACVRRLDAREFRAMGLTDVALALLCQSDANRRAVEATGHLCPGTTAARPFERGAERGSDGRRRREVS